jgi:SNF family Na+-dependent transporter
VNYKLMVSLLVCWLLIFLALSKGVATLGKVSYVTAIFPYIMITALIIRGITLPGAYKGIEYYILKLNTKALFKMQTWIDAINQVYFCLGITQGSLYTLGRHNKFHYNHERTCVFIVFLDGFTGILAGFAIFSVLGYMSERTGIEVSDLAVGGPGLSFIVYPEALSLMPFPWIWCIFFFLMMIVIGFGSILSWMECVLDSSTEILKNWRLTEFLVNNKRKELALRLTICLMFFTVGVFTLTTRNGIYVEHLMDNYVTGYPVLICAMLESIALGWIYGNERLRKDLKLMSGKYPGMYWSACFLVLTPLFTALGVVLSIIGNSEVMLNDYHYPAWAHDIGWFLVILVLSPLGIVFLQQLITNKFNLKSLFEPSPDWLPALPLSGEDIMDTDGNGSDSDEKDMNIEQVAASNVILLSHSKQNKSHYYNNFSRSDSWKKHTTEV